MPPIELHPRRKRSFPPGRDADRPEPDPFDIFETLEEVRPAIQDEGRFYPRLAQIPRNRERELELALKDQWKELSARCIQVADLCNAQQQQAAELQTARTALADLEQCVGLLQAALSQQESETAAARETLAQAEQDRAALRRELAAVKSGVAQWHRHASELRAAYEARGATLESMREKIESLELQLTAKTAEAENLATPIEEERKQHRAELTQQRVRCEIEISRVTRLLEEREQQLETLQGTHSQVAKRYHELAQAAESHEIAQKTAREHAKSQAELIQVLEALLKVERETAERKTAELAAALEHERAARADAERSSATMRKDIVSLLPKLVARRGDAEAGAPAKHEDAA